MATSSIPHAPGIYKITCTANGKIYVGSTNDFCQRWISHLSELRRGIHYNRHLQNAWNKYGESAFIFEILELVTPWALIEREQVWLDKLKPFGEVGFNGNRKADKPPSPKGRAVSPETREKLRIASTGKKNALGRKHTPEEIAKISASKLGKKRAPFDEEWRSKLGQRTKGKPLSAEHREKIRAARLGHKVSDATRAKISATKRARKSDKQPPAASGDGGDSGT